MKCKQCGARCRFKVALLLDCDARVFRRLSKANLRTSLVSVDGADWPAVYWYCPRSHKHTIPDATYPFGSPPVEARGEGKGT